MTTTIPNRYVSRAVCVLLAGILLSATGCAARRVVRASDHGVVAIPADSNGWPCYYRDKAHELMSEHFPQGYVIEHEEETVVGQHVHTSIDGQGTTIMKNGPIELTSGSAETTTTTSPQTEWRIHYRRK